MMMNTYAVTAVLPGGPRRKELAEKRRERVGNLRKEGDCPAAN